LAELFDTVRSKGAGSLVGVLGFEPVDAGPLKNARLLEPFAMVWIDQAMRRGRDFAFALVKMRAARAVHHIREIAAITTNLR
jgi:8-hydroxy-5-deazaflavin:NADPH oxidoreductase